MMVSSSSHTLSPCTFSLSLAFPLLVQPLAWLGFWIHLQELVYKDPRRGEVQEEVDQEQKMMKKKKEKGLEWKQKRCDPFRLEEETDNGA